MSPPAKKAKLLQKTLQFASTPRASGKDSASSTQPAKTHHFFDRRPSQSSAPPDSSTTTAAPPSTDKQQQSPAPPFSPVGKKRQQADQPFSQRKRAYHQDYIKYGFTYNNDKDQPQCVVCGYLLAHESMKPVKMLRHLTTEHAEHVDKPVEYFRRQEKALRGEKKTITDFTTIQVHVFPLLAVVISSIWFIDCDWNKEIVNSTSSMPTVKGSLLKKSTLLAPIVFFIFYCCTRMLPSPSLGVDVHVFPLFATVISSLFTLKKKIVMFDCTSDYLNKSWKYDSVVLCLYLLFVGVMHTFWQGIFCQHIN